MSATFVVLISANAEWRAARALFQGIPVKTYPYGEWFETTLKLTGAYHRLLFFHGGWGKIDAAGSTQYIIDHWKSDLLVNLGTCGGFDGQVSRGVVILVERTLVYDIEEQMGDQAAHIAHYTTKIDLSWLDEPYPSPVQRALLISADRDLRPQELPRLHEMYGAVAGDWESGAIARVAARNQIPLLILRGVSDLVSSEGGEAYDGNMEVFQQSAEAIMRNLIAVLPAWLERWLIKKQGALPAQPPV